MSKKPSSKESTNYKAVIKFDSGERAGLIDAEARTISTSMDSTKPTEFSNGAWVIPIKLIEFMYKNKLTLVVDDKRNRWKLQLTYDDAIYHGDKGVSNYKIPKKAFTVLKAKTTTHVTLCDTDKCQFCYFKMCLKGTIELVEGRCRVYGGDTGKGVAERK